MKPPMNDCKTCRLNPCGYRVKGGKDCLSYEPQPAHLTMSTWRPPRKKKVQPQPARQPDMPDYLL